MRVVQNQIRTIALIRNQLSCQWCATHPRTQPPTHTHTKCGSLRFALWFVSLFRCYYLFGLFARFFIRREPAAQSLRAFWEVYFTHYRTTYVNIRIGIAGFYFLASGTFFRLCDRIEKKTWKFNYTRAENVSHIRKHIMCVCVLASGVCGERSFMAKTTKVPSGQMGSNAAIYFYCNPIRTIEIRSIHVADIATKHKIRLPTDFNVRNQRRRWRKDEEETHTHTPTQTHSSCKRQKGTYVTHSASNVYSLHKDGSTKRMMSMGAQDSRWDKSLIEAYQDKNHPEGIPFSAARPKNKT